MKFGIDFKKPSLILVAVFLVIQIFAFFNFFKFGIILFSLVSILIIVVSLIFLFSDYKYKYVLSSIPFLLLLLFPEIMININFGFSGAIMSLIRFITRISPSFTEFLINLLLLLGFTGYLFLSQFWSEKLGKHEKIFAIVFGVLLLLKLIF